MGPRCPPPFTSAPTEKPGVLILWPQGPQWLLLPPALQVQIQDPTVSSQGQALGPHGALPAWRPPPLLKSEQKLLLVKLAKPVALADPVPRGRSSSGASPALWVSRSDNWAPPLIAERLLPQSSSHPRNMPQASPYFLQSLQQGLQEESNLLLLLF